MNDIRRPRLLASVIVTAIAFVVYALTLAPSLDFIDAGELATVAHTWGIAHPTGYPLFTILAGLWALLPLGSGIFRLNLFAAVLSATAAGVAVQLFFDLLRVRPEIERKKAKGKKKSSSGANAGAAATTTPGASASGASASGTGAAAAPGAAIAREDAVTALKVASSAALLLAFGGTYWRTALSIEVYALHILMLALVLWSAVRLLFLPAAGPTVLRRRMALTAFLLGLSFANHMSTVFLLPALLLLLPVTHRRAAGFPAQLAIAVAAFVAGLLPYAYLPLRAAARPLLNWGNPIDLERLLWHASGKQYSVWMFSSAEAWRKQFAYALEAFGRDLAWLALLPAAVGFVVLLRQGWKVAVFWILLFLTCLIWAAGYDIHDIDSYFLLAYFTLAAWVAVGLRAITRWRPWRTLPVPFRDPLLLGVVLLVPLLLQWGRVSQAGNHLVEDYSRAMFASFDDRAVVFSFQWDFWVSASYYLQYVEGHRGDVVVLDKELFRRSWYFDQLRRNHPELVADAEQEITTFLALLRRFERDEPYDPAAIEAAFNAVVNGIIDRAYAQRPVYVTIEMEEQFAPGYVRVPQGLAFRLYKPEDLPDPATTADVPVRIRPFESDERLPAELRRLTASMLLNRGVYLSNAGLHDRAEAVLRQALEVVPGDARVIEYLQRNTEGKAGR